MKYLKTNFKKFVNEGIENLFSDENSRAIRSWDTSKKVTKHTIDVKEPFKIVITDDLDASRLKSILNKYEIEFDYDWEEDVLESKEDNPTVCRPPYDENDVPHESGAYLQDGMPGDLDRNGHPIPTIEPDFRKMGFGK